MSQDKDAMDHGKVSVSLPLSLSSISASLSCMQLYKQSLKKKKKNRLCNCSLRNRSFLETLFLVSPFSMASLPPSEFHVNSPPFSFVPPNKYIFLGNIFSFAYLILHRNEIAWCIVYDMRSSVNIVLLDSGTLMHAAVVCFLLCNLDDHCMTILSHSHPTSYDHLVVPSILLLGTRLLRTSCTTVLVHMCWKQYIYTQDIFLSSRASWLQVLHMWDSLVTAKLVSKVEISISPQSLQHLVSLDFLIWSRV